MSLPLPEGDLRAMIDEIVRRTQPLRVVLFGSYARGCATPESDIDLCIIEPGAFGKHRSRRKEAARIYRLLSRWPAPKDILLFGDEELDRPEIREFIENVCDSGMVLYERPAG